MFMPSRYLIAPLDWGLGHATRCIPVVRALLSRGQEVVIAAQGARAVLLKREFPELTIVPIVDYDIRYGTAVLGLYLRFPFMVLKVWRRAGRERRQLRALVREHRIDVVISDNRFGLHTPDAYCVYMTHQLCVKMPRGFGWLQRIVAGAHRRVVSRFDELWIPDVPGDGGLTGDLTRAYGIPDPHRFVGVLSRFSDAAEVKEREAGLDLLVMISGPEPQRSLFEKRIRAELDEYDGRAVVLLGKPGPHRDREVHGQVTWLSHVSGQRAAALIRSAGAIVCRAGYTTIMELVSLDRRAVLVPTPGQSEQEYLADRMASRYGFVHASQRQFCLSEAVSKLSESGDGMPSVRLELLEEAVEGLVRLQADNSVVRPRSGD